MENVSIEGTDRNPKVEFDYASSRFSLGGYSYPENVKEFYGPIMDPLFDYLDDLKGGQVQFEFAFHYFHSSSAQVLYTLFDKLEGCASRGIRVSVTWHYETDDDAMEEAGEDFSEEAEHVDFAMREMEPT